METVNFGRALYYPHIFPQTRLWLRTAALYHEAIGRIVPENFVEVAYDRNNGPELFRDFQALQAAGFIEDNHPHGGVLQDVGEQFLSFIAPLLEGPKRRARLIEVLDSGEWQPYNMYRAKIEPALLDLLESEGLVRVYGREVEFDQAVGGLYMLFLARQMAKHQPIVSDDPLFDALTHRQFEHGGQGSASGDRGLLLARAVFTSAVPFEIESVDIDDLIKFRQDFKGERIAFMIGLPRAVQISPKSMIRSSFEMRLTIMLLASKQGCRD